jgi:hypothetical protein
MIDEIAVNKVHCVTGNALALPVREPPKGIEPLT